jgi:hypothetical protein
VEVRPEYQGQGIGGELMRRILDGTDRFYSVDLLCDTALVPYYAMRHPAALPDPAPAGRPLTSRRDSGTVGRVAPALVPPVLAELVVVQPAQQVRVMIQPVGGSLHLVEVLPVIAGRRFLLASLTHDMQLFLAQLHDLGQCFFQIHRVPFPAHRMPR